METYAFVQNFSDVGNHCWNYWQPIFNKKDIFLLVENIFFDFIVRKSSFFVSRKRIFQRMLRSGWWKRIFWLVQTIFYIFFQRPLLEKALFLSSGNLFLNESFTPAIGEEFFYLMETVTLLESFLLLPKTVTAMSRNQFLKTKPILA